MLKASVVLSVVGLKYAMSLYTCTIDLSGGGGWCGQ